MQKRSFTLVEILTVIAIMAVLSGITVGVVSLINNKNAEARTIATIKALELAMAQYKNDNGTFYFPTGAAAMNPERFTISRNIPSAVRGTLLQYLDQKLINSSTVEDGGIRYFVDGWNRPLIYRVPGRFNRTGFDLGSAGPDGRIGDNGTPITTSVPNSIPDYDNFGQGDDIVNFLRN